MTEQPLYSPDMLRGQVAVVTGGGSGIELAISEAFLRYGAEVLITSRDADRLARGQSTLTERTGRPTSRDASVARRTATAPPRDSPK